MKILVLQHVPHEHPGYISDYANEHSIELDIIELWKPYSLPAIGGYEAIIIMGGPMGVYEDYPSKDDEIQLIKQAIDTVPVIGLCLGSQLIAAALGAKVYPNLQDGKKLKEVGYYLLNLTPGGKRSKLFSGFPNPMKALEWHGDVFDLPESAELLASSSQCKNQAFSYKNLHGTLFHFEFTPEMVEQQIKIDKQWIHEDNELDEEALIKESKHIARLMKDQCYQLLDNLLATK